MQWFTSDYHLDHLNIIKYSNRPFSSVEEMNEAILDRVNQKVKFDDELYFLGDFVFGQGKLEKVPKFRKRINCDNIYYIRGNHDEWSHKHYDDILHDGIFRWIKDVFYLKTVKPNVFLSHYCHKVWEASHKGVYHLWGHSHGTLPDDPNSLSMDVGVDCNNFYPYSYEDVKKLMANKTWTQVDHHNSRTN